MWLLKFRRDAGKEPKRVAPEDERTLDQMVKARWLVGVGGAGLRDGQGRPVEVPDVVGPKIGERR